jgi:glycogen operon protein
VATVSLLDQPILLHLIINAYWAALEFEVPPRPQPHQAWRRCVDTSCDPPEDISDWANARNLSGSTCVVQPRSVVILLAKG